MRSLRAILESIDALKRAVFEAKEKRPPLWTGQRFEALVQELMTKIDKRTGKPYTREAAEALAAYIGRKKYGPSKFNARSAQARRRAK